MNPDDPVSEEDARDALRHLADEFEGITLTRTCERCGHSEEEGHPDAPATVIETGEVLCPPCEDALDVEAEVEAAED